MTTYLQIAITTVATAGSMWIVFRIITDFLLFVMEWKNEEPEEKTYEVMTLEEFVERMEGTKNV